MFYPIGIIALNSFLKCFIHVPVIDVIWWLKMGFEDVHCGLSNFMEFGPVINGGIQVCFQGVAVQVINKFHLVYLVHLDCVVEHFG